MCFESDMIVLRRNQSGFNKKKYNNNRFMRYVKSFKDFEN